MHELAHIAVLLFTLCGAASLVLLALWPVLADRPLQASAKAVMAALVALGAASLLAEWLLVH